MNINAELRKLFRLNINNIPLKEGDSWVINYSTGCAVISEGYFTAGNSKPILRINPISEKTESGTYYFRRQSSNPHHLEVFKVDIFKKEKEVFNGLKEIIIETLETADLKTLVRVAKNLELL